MGKVLIALSILMAMVSCSPRLYPERPETWQGIRPETRADERKTVRLMTYNVGVFDKYEASGIKLTARIVREMDPDVLVMNEVDSCAGRTGNLDQLRAFTRAARRYDGVFAPALKPFMGGAYGIAEAWKRLMEPIGTFSMVLPKGDGSEPRALVVVEYDDMVVAGTHLDHRSKAAQLEQARAITDTLMSMYSGKPVFLCGDFNALPDSPTIEYMRENWDILSPAKTTYPDSKALPSWEPDDDVPGKCIDYIMVLKGSAEYEVVAADVPVTFKAGSAFEASDHLPVYVDVRF